MFGVHFGCGLVFTQTLECGLADHAVPGPSGKLDLGDQAGFDPSDVFVFARSVFASEGALVRGERNKFLQQPLRIALVETSPDTPGMYQMVSAIDTDEKRA